MREERGLRVFVNRVLRRIFGSKRDEVSGSGANYIVRSFVINIHHQLLVGNSERNRPLGRPGFDERIILKCIFIKWIEEHRPCRSGSR